ncbi:hypothetical protein A2Z22_03570 [Candidatus Woesebacteria bacterium RBG_16_34_12]|uniref:Glycosyltransferase 2-like domain-containing protein n=1 Tax=Candidatus Woesebacteria bacterium RBG_16_34_12 TaxID=1802480 RepID=A0A1F7XAV9_9BACT|nr:MAG: hypothetical protein A2Z22_03570 [Candidatus Woesebacteria bacterium RBG_16_34_12]
MKVSCIVTAFNEEKNVSNVLEVLIKSPLLDEIIVVDNGSKDSTAQIVKDKFPKIRLITKKNNQGKAGGMFLGAKKAKDPILFFCDADLTNLQIHHIEKLILPVIKGKTRMVVGAQEFMNVFKKQSDEKMTDFIQGLGGEKVLFKKDFFAIPDIQSSKYAVEYKIINFFEKNNWPFKKIILKKVGHVHKIKKWGINGIFIEIGTWYIFLSQFVARLIRKKKVL